MCPLPGTGVGGTFTKGNLYPTFRKKEEGKRTPPVFAVSQLPAAKNNQYTKVTYFGVA